MVKTARVWWDDQREVYIVTDYNEAIPGREIVGVVDGTYPDSDPVCIGCGVTAGASPHDWDEWLDYSKDHRGAVCPECPEHLGRWRNGNVTFVGDDDAEVAP